MAGRGIDVGTAFLVGAQMDPGGDIAYKSTRNAFLEVEATDFTKNMLKKANVSFVEVTKGKPSFYVLGDAGLQMATMFKDAKLRRPLAQGVLARGETQAVDVLTSMLSDILGKPSVSKELCYYSIPADARDTGQDARFHEAQIKKILDYLGFESKPLNEAHAVVFSSCKKTDFTGLAFSFGAGMVNACLSYKAMSVVEFAVARGGDWIDTKAAESVGRPVPQVTILKEKPWDLRDPKTREQEALAVYYKQLIRYLIDTLVEVLETQGTTLLEAIPVVISGGTSLVGGFVETFQQELAQRTLPIEVGSVTPAKNPLHAVAAGLLMAAMLSE